MPSRVQGFRKRTTCSGEEQVPRGGVGTLPRDLSPSNPRLPPPEELEGAPCRCHLASWLLSHRTQDLGKLKDPPSIIPPLFSVWETSFKTQSKRFLLWDIPHPATIPLLPLSFLHEGHCIAAGETVCTWPHHSQSPAITKVGWQPVSMSS